MSNIWMYIFVFVAMAATDFVWAKYLLAVGNYQRLAGSLWSMAIVILGSFVTIEYIHDTTMVIPAALGCFVGTWLSVGKKPDNANT